MTKAADGAIENPPGTAAPSSSLEPPPSQRRAGQEMTHATHPTTLASTLAAGGKVRAGNSASAARDALLVRSDRPIHRAKTKPPRCYSRCPRIRGAGRAGNPTFPRPQCPACAAGFAGARPRSGAGRGPWRVVVRGAISGCVRLVPSEFRGRSVRISLAFFVNSLSPFARDTTALVSATLFPPSSVSYFPARTKRSVVPHCSNAIVVPFVRYARPWPGTCHPSRRRGRPAPTGAPSQCTTATIPPARRALRPARLCNVRSAAGVRTLPQYHAPTSNAGRASNDHHSRSISGRFPITTVHLASGCASPGRILVFRKSIVDLIARPPPTDRPASRAGGARSLSVKVTYVRASLEFRYRRSTPTPTGPDPDRRDRQPQLNASRLRAGEARTGLAIDGGDRASCCGDAGLAGLAVGMAPRPVLGAAGPRARDDWGKLRSPSFELRCAPLFEIGANVGKSAGKACSGAWASGRDASRGSDCLESESVD
ncbi:uncharacterized protein C8Q71DRAFT_415032 [Rhodofomes roseus]|uniref:Uncharacterized protein n=1 Tax=Rhodofomes roseus TaxID=34475 RepID=A0ABQ8KQ11_9APHY|nr:uncharacterized protein C8Q71DRAFT_415032 [Rhodofomes roseus]KAH9840600.1 hypothetical protein C8Q71DRAFT_415032 [Rhodofomes roseus]